MEDRRKRFTWMVPWERERERGIPVRDLPGEMRMHGERGMDVGGGGREEGKSYVVRVIVSRAVTHSARARARNAVVATYLSRYPGGEMNIHYIEGRGRVGGSEGVVRGILVRRITSH